MWEVEWVCERGAGTYVRPAWCMLANALASVEMAWPMLWKRLRLKLMLVAMTLEGEGGQVMSCHVMANQYHLIKNMSRTTSLGYAMNFKHTWGKEVALGVSPLKVTPGLLATPCRASDHHW